jgi:hypothetical protein
LKPSREIGPARVRDTALHQRKSIKGKSIKGRSLNEGPRPRAVGIDAA